MLLSAVKRSQTGPGLCKERRIGCFSGPSGLLDPPAGPWFSSKPKGCGAKRREGTRGKKDTRLEVWSWKYTEADIARPTQDDGVSIT